MQNTRKLTLKRDDKLELYLKPALKVTINNVIEKVSADSVMQSIDSTVGENSTLEANREQEFQTTLELTTGGNESVEKDTSTCSIFAHIYQDDTDVESSDVSKELPPICLGMNQNDTDVEKSSKVKIGINHEVLSVKENEILFFFDK